MQPDPIQKEEVIKIKPNFGVIFLSISIFLLILSNLYLFYQINLIKNDIGDIKNLKSEAINIIPTPTPQLAIKSYKTSRGFTYNLNTDWVFHADDQLRDPWASYKSDGTNESETRLISRIYTSEDTIQEDLYKYIPEFDAVEGREEIKVDGKDGLISLSLDKKTGIAIIGDNQNRFEFTISNLNSEVTFQDFKKIVNDIKFTN